MIIINKSTAYTKTSHTTTHTVGDTITCDIVTKNDHFWVNLSSIKKKKWFLDFLCGQTTVKNNAKISVVHFYEPFLNVWLPDRYYC